MQQGASSILREALSHSGMTARELSRRTGVTEGRISNYLSGKHEPGADRLIDLVAATGHEVSLRRDLDRNGLVLGELMDLADALCVDGETRRADRLPTFKELIARSA